MIPVIALVGRPNVGKSTLFNSLTRSQNALVADLPGLTRDRQYGEASFSGKDFIVIDTGGLGVDDVEVDALMSKQASIALDEADLILFLVDGRSGLQGLDQSIAQRLRKLNKPVVLVVNKTEGLESALVCAEFQYLGFNQTYAISSAHGQGLKSMLEELTAEFPQENEDGSLNPGIKIAFIGRPNVGKSTLVNRILGEERMLVYDMPGTTRDSIAVAFSKKGKDYTLIDTAGIRRRSRVNEKIEKFSIIKTLQSIKASQVCLMLLDGQEGVTDQDLHLLSFIVEAGKALVILVNKWDGLDKEHRDKVNLELERRLSFVNFAKIRLISALRGTGIGPLFQDIDEAYASATKLLSTPQLTRLLQDLVAEHSPPLVNGRRIKLKHAHAGGHNPPVIVIHGNQLQALPESYKRYLVKAFSSHLNLTGTPLKLEFKVSDNPFKHKKNKLTERQIKQRKRLIKRVKRRG